MFTPYGLGKSPERRPIVHRSTQRTRPLAIRMQPIALAVAACAILGALAPARAADVPYSFADMAGKLLPAVVNISTTQTLDRGEPSPPGAPPNVPQFPPGSPFEEFFREFFERRGGALLAPKPRRVASLGSGFVVSADGYVVTNNHVIDGADKITVVLQDGAPLEAKLVGRDSKIDIALLKVESGKPMPFVKWGDSDTARVGDWVLAIGNPFGLGGTVTSGIISAKTRNLSAGPYDAFIQTDASINKGNSGGPLFNMNGEVVGVNTAIYSPSGGSVGIGFASPSNLVKTVIPDLKKYGHTRRGWLGVRIQNVTDEIAESLGMNKAHGALITSVDDDAPADEAGIQAGDVIVEWNGKPVPTMRRLPIMVAATPIGSRVDVALWRDGENKTVSVTVGEMKEEDKTRTARGRMGAGDVDDLGVAVAAIDAAARNRYSLPKDVAGVIITKVDANGPAAEKNLRPGDVIMEVGQKAVAIAADVRKGVKAAKTAGRKSVLLLVRNKRGMRFVAVSLTG